MAHPAHAHSGCAAPGYERRRPEQTLLHQTLTAHWPRFLALADEHGGLPDFVVREVEDYLECGILEHGCVSVVCRDCGFERVVGLSCKHRGFCPSCCGRRMSDTSAHLVDSVLPEVPIRQWVCSLPWRIRVAVGYDRSLCAAVMGAFATELMRSHKRRAKRALALISVSEAHTGAITFVQRFDSALRLSPHAHVLVPDGLYVRTQDGGLEFQPLAEPTLAEVNDVAARTATRIEHVLLQHGYDFDERSDVSDSDQLALEFPALASCYQAAQSGRPLLPAEPGQPALRLLSAPPERKPPKQDPLVAEVRGVNVHAQRVVDGRDRAQLERLCRYLARPPLSHDRLTEMPDGQLCLALKTPWSDGTTAIVLSPMDLIARLCALIPPARFHMTRFAGVFAPNASLRPLVVPQPHHDPELDPPQQLPLFDEQARFPAPPPDPDSPQRTAGRHPWAWLLRRTFQVDLSVCPKCSGSTRITDVALTADSIATVLARHGLGPRPPPPRAVEPVPGQLGLPGVPLH